MTSTPSGKMTWDDVKKLHRSANGIFEVDKELVSILCGNEAYGDKILEDEISYTVPAKPQHRFYLNAFLNAKLQGNNFVVFRKIERNSWVNYGKFLVESINSDEKFHRIKLHRFINK